MLGPTAAISGLTAGCSPNETTLSATDAENEPDDVDDAAPEQAVPEAGAPITVASCPAPHVEITDELRAFERLVAQVVDADDAPVADMLAQACGTNLCLAEKTNAAGRVSLSQSPPVEMRRVAFKYGDGLRYAQFAWLLPDVSEHDLGAQRTFALPQAEPAAFEPGTTLRAQNIALDLTDETHVQVDALSFPAPEQQRFAALEIEPELWPEAVPKDQDFEILLGMGPVKTRFCPAAHLTIANSPGWPAGAAVEFWLHITDAASYWGAYGSFARVSLGNVSDDAESIQTADGAGIPELGVLAVRLSP